MITYWFQKLADALDQEADDLHVEDEAKFGLGAGDYDHIALNREVTERRALIAVARMMSRVLRKVSAS